MEINGCVALVTGGASGLGEACVHALVKDKAKVCICDFDEERGKKVAAELGGDVIFCKTDVADEKTVQDAIDKTVKSFGAIHVAINCAGVLMPAKVLGKDGPMSMNTFNRVLQINLMGTMNVIRLVIQHMLKNNPNEDGEKGVIINTSSAAAFEGQIGQAAYSASKGGLVAITLQLAREFSDYGIRVMTIAPGLFDTPMIAGLPDKAREALLKLMVFPKRFGKPSDFAQLAKHIIENPMLNGETIRLDGAVRMAAK